MAFPFFYISDFDPDQSVITLDEDQSRHIVQVLRMQTGERLNLTDGRGNLIEAVILDSHKKHCTVTFQETQFTDAPVRYATIAMSLLKNTNRFEWFLEKATELGIREIVPLVCKRTEKEKFRHDRMKQICISAMLQSQQVWLPVLSEPVEFDEFITLPSAPSKYIAHCMEGEKESLSAALHTNDHSTVILIGPEGDFTPEEVSLATTNGYKAVSLGQTRLRTETAGVAAAVLVVSL